MSPADHTDPTPEAQATPWLTPTEGAAWWPLAGLISKLPAALERQLQRDAGISHFEYIVLSQLSTAPQRTLHMSDLAELANGSISRLSHAIKRLEHRGWVYREPCPENGRYINAILSDDGYAKVAATAPGHVRAVRELVIDALSPAQLRQLRDIGELIMRRIEPEPAWSPLARGGQGANDAA